MKVSRSKVYDKPKPEIKEDDMKLMKLILLIYDELPFYGCRRIRYELRERHQIKISKNRVWRLMKLLGIWVLDQTRANQ
jgi:hypothetical protein